MKTCALCHEEITSQMIRRGTVISRGSQVFHRECRRGGKPAPEIVDEEQLAESGEGFEADLDLSTETEEEVSFGPIRVVKYASAGRRFAAHIIDGIILNIIVAVPSFVAGLVIGRFAVEGAALIATIVGWAIGLFVPLTYALLFWTKKGATPGKMALGIRIVSADNGPLSGEQSFIRFLGYIPSGLVLGLGYFAMLWDGENRCWHDRMAGTRVIRV